MDTIEKMAAQPGMIVFLSLTFWLLCFVILRLLLGALLRMHKSKTSVKKIEKQYTFWQKLCLKHVAQHCEHAVKFTQFMILVHNIYTPSTFLLLISGLLMPGRLFACVMIGKWILMDLPIMLLMQIMDAHPFQKRKHAWRFAKYHNSSDRTSLF